MKRIILAALAVAAICTAPALRAADRAAHKPSGKAKAAPARAGTRQITTFGIIPKRIGGEWLLKDPRGVYEFIAQLGYKQIERNDNYGMTPQACRAFLDSLKLKTIIWGFTGPDDIISFATEGKTEGIDQCIALAKAAGAKYVVAYSSTKKYTSTIEGWKEWAGVLNKTGEYCLSKGMKLLCHNHAIEFTPVDGQLPFDVLVPNLDPRFCNMEFDVYWCAKGGSDPVAVMKKYPGRMTALHLKDMADGPDRAIADMGQGIMNFEPIFDAAPAAGVKFYIIENDNPADPRTSIRRGAEFFRTFRY